MEKLKTLTYETTGRIARMSVSQLIMMKLTINQMKLVSRKPSANATNSLASQVLNSSQ